MKKDNEEEVTKLSAAVHREWTEGLTHAVLQGECSLSAAIYSAIDNAYDLGRRHQRKEDDKQINDLLDIVVGGVHAREACLLGLMQIGALKDPPKGDNDAA